MVVKCGCSLPPSFEVCCHLHIKLTGNSVSGLFLKLGRSVFAGYLVWRVFACDLCCMLRGDVNRGNKVAKAMITLKHKGLATDTKCPSCPEQPDSTRVIMELEGHDPLRAEPLIQEGGDNGDHGENHDVAIAAGDGGYGLNNLDPGAIVDGILADLPEPSRRHILPELEEYDRARPADLCSAT